MGHQPERTARFQTPASAAAITGIGRDYIYAGCKEGTIPHIKIRNEYRVDMDEWSKMLTEQSRSSLKRKDGAEDGN